MEHLDALSLTLASAKVCLLQSVYVSLYIPDMLSVEEGSSGRD